MAFTQNYDLDVDTSLGGNAASDYVIPSQKAIKSYVDASTGSTVDQIFDGTSQNAQSGVAIEGELANYVLTSSLATVATSGDYDDLLNKPTIPTYSDFTGADSVTAGTNGLVPAPSAGDDDKILTGGGTWESANTVIGYTPANTDLSNLSATGEAHFQTPLVSGTNIKTINNTSLLGSGNIDVLQNTATGTESLTLLGTATTNNYSINIGYDSATKGAESIAIGHLAEIDNTNGAFSVAIGSNARISVGSAVAIGSGADVYGSGGVSIGSGASSNGTYSIGIGCEANAMYNSSIQIGYGINSTANTLSVGFFNNTSTHYNWQLLDGTTGLIPDARISSNIAKTSQIPDTSNLANKDLSNLSSTGEAKFQAPLGYTPANTDLNNLSSTGKKVIDGQWVRAANEISNSKTVGTTSLKSNINSIIPNDGHVYELILDIVALGNGNNSCELAIQSTLSYSPWVIWISNGSTACTRLIVPVAADRELNKIITSNAFNACSVYLSAYRRIGSNS